VFVCVFTAKPGLAALYSKSDLSRHYYHACSFKNSPEFGAAENALVGWEKHNVSRYWESSDPLKLL